MFDIEFGAENIKPITSRGSIFLESIRDGHDANISNLVNYRRATAAGLAVNFTTAAVRDWVTGERLESVKF